MVKKERFYSRHVIEKSLRHHIIEWSATALSIFGAVLNANKLIAGFYVWSIANILWLSFSWKHKHWGLFVMNIIFLGINIWGIINWWDAPLLSGTN